MKIKNKVLQLFILFWGGLFFPLQPSFSSNLIEESSSAGLNFIPEIFLSILTFLDEKSLREMGRTCHRFENLSNVCFQDKVKKFQKPTILPSKSRAPWKFTFYARRFLKEGGMLAYVSSSSKKRSDRLKKIENFFKNHDSYLSDLFLYLSLEGKAECDEEILKDYLQEQSKQYKEGNILAREIEFMLSLYGNLSFYALKGIIRSKRSQKRPSLLISFQDKAESLDDHLFNQILFFRKLKKEKSCQEVYDYYIAALSKNKQIALRYALAECFQKNKMWEEAIQQFEKILKQGKIAKLYLRIHYDQFLIRWLRSAGWNYCDDYYELPLNILSQSEEVKKIMQKIKKEFLNMNYGFLKRRKIFFE